MLNLKVTKIETLSDWILRVPKWVQTYPLYLAVQISCPNQLETSIRCKILWFLANLFCNLLSTSTQRVQIKEQETLVIEFKSLLSPKIKNLSRSLTTTVLAWSKVSSWLNKKRFSLLSKIYNSRKIIIKDHLLYLLTAGKTFVKLPLI